MPASLDKMRSYWAWVVSTVLRCHVCAPFVPRSPVGHEFSDAATCLYLYADRAVTLLPPDELRRHHRDHDREDKEAAIQLGSQPPITKLAFDGEELLEAWAARLGSAAFTALASTNITWPPANTVPAWELRAALTELLRQRWRARRNICHQPEDAAAVLVRAAEGTRSAPCADGGPSSAAPDGSGLPSKHAGGGEPMFGIRRGGSAVAVDLDRRVVYVANLKAGCTSLQVYRAGLMNYEPQSTSNTVPTANESLANHESR